MKKQNATFCRIAAVVTLAPATVCLLLGATPLLYFWCIISAVYNVGAMVIDSLDGGAS